VKKPSTIAIIISLLALILTAGHIGVTHADDINLIYRDLDGNLSVFSVPERKRLRANTIGGKGVAVPFSCRKRGSKDYISQGSGKIVAYEGGGYKHRTVYDFCPGEWPELGDGAHNPWN